jgi:hypothetical protein
MISKTQKIFHKSLLAKSITLMLGTAVVFPVMAQEVDNTEVIQVKGVRGSLSQSMDIKRQSAGVVDAISAVDMGKFPDTNYRCIHKPC